jgi:hypothetical protein
MTRQEAEVIAEALREYVDTMAFVATAQELDSAKSLKVQRLTFEKLRAALIGASRHG